MSVVGPTTPAKEAKERLSRLLEQDRAVTWEPVGDIAFMATSDRPPRCYVVQFPDQALGLAFVKQHPTSAVRVKNAVKQAAEFGIEVGDLLLGVGDTHPVRQQDTVEDVKRVIKAQPRPLTLILEAWNDRRQRGAAHNAREREGGVAEATERLKARAAEPRLKAAAGAAGAAAAGATAADDRQGGAAPGKSATAPSTPIQPVRTTTNAVFSAAHKAIRGVGVRHDTETRLRVYALYKQAKERRSVRFLHVKGHSNHRTRTRPV